MGFHVCEYLTRDEAAKLGFRHATQLYSSGDITLSFQSDRSWTMPDMALLYVEIGWVPPTAFIDDVMESPLVAGQRVQTRSVSAEPVKIGYLNARDSPLPRPFKISDKLPEGFLERLEALVTQASDMGNRVQTKSFQSKPGMR